MRQTVRTLHNVCGVVDGRTEFLHVQLNSNGCCCVRLSDITVVLLSTLLLVLLPIIASIVASIDDSV
jgi:hypothetical protein